MRSLLMLDRERAMSEAGAGGGLKPPAPEAIAQRIEGLEALDALAEPLQKGVRTLVPQESPLKDLLSGTWLGHPLHPPLTDVVVGAWTSALLLDLVGGDRGEQAADRLVAAGILAAVPTAAAGLSDWAELRGGTRRVGTIHASGNVSALVLHALSWTARRRGQRGRGVVLSALGYGVATFSAWLGGHLSFGKGVGVNQTAFEDAPSGWTPVLDEAQLGEDQLIRALANGVGVLLVRKDARISALADRCSHRGCSLHEGQLNDDTVTCPCHGSTFRLDGSVVKGPATAPQPRFDVRASEGKVEIRRAEAT
ncbi:MAG TPA: Rieske 2Fe-2S domain-containing protein [Thermoleophilaceae bacterium]|nr:Rieske 2Fe-2S domain-containing protein [Thermoleophilaceae bacterium]